MNVRSIGGRAIDVAAALLGLYHVSRYRLLSALGVATFQHAAEAVATIPFFFGARVRRRFYEAVLGRCGEALEVNVGATIAEAASTIGDRVWVGPGAYLDLVDIGDDVLIGPHVCVLAGGSHHRMDRLDVPIRQQGNHPLSPTVVGTGAWIGANATVLADIGDHAVVGAGAVVVEPVPPYAVAVGNPARVVRDRRTLAGT